jgi:hypothetical protein
MGIYSSEPFELLPPYAILQLKAVSGMAEEPRKIGKIERILSIYHLLKFCDEVTMWELMDNLPGTPKTFQRDIALLKSAGVRVNHRFRQYYGVRRKAFVLDSRERNAPDYPDNQAQIRQIDKIIRLIIMMDEIPPEDCDIWYRKTFPKTSPRTMQRDFATLKAIGFEIKYKREWEDPEFKGDEDPVNRYYCNAVYDTYGLATFKRGRG